MIMSFPPKNFLAIAQGRRTALAVAEGPLRLAPGDRIRIEDTTQPARTVTVVVTDVWRHDGQDSLVSIRRLADLSEIPTPGGVIRAIADPDDDYGGIALTIDGQVAAVVEWHPIHHSMVLRTYNNHDEEPQHYHRWDGSALDS